MTTKRTITAAGRKISGKNADKLQTAFLELGAVLIDAGVIGEDSLKELLEDAEEEANETPEEKVKEDSEEISAAAKNDFIRTVKLKSWVMELNTTLKYFGDRLEMMFAASDAVLLQVLGKVVDRTEGATQLQADLKILLIDLCAKHPGAMDSTENYYSYDYMNMAAAPDAKESVQAVSTLIDQVKRSTWHGRLETTLRIFKDQYTRLHLCPAPELARMVGAGVTRSDAIAQCRDDLFTLLAELGSDHPDAAENGESYSPYFQLSAVEPKPPAVKTPKEEMAADLEDVVELAIACEAIPIQARSAIASNRREFEGVLFRIDEPSECAPSVGPGLPLYIPRSVAESAVHSCSGLPLDADSSLSRHANHDIAGVMMAARIEGNDFIVSGYLYDWSRGEKVNTISANKDNLGMSMNASAVGREVDTNGQKVYWIDSLDLLGANILYAAKATYQKTRVLSAGTDLEHLENTELDDTAIAEEDLVVSAQSTKLDDQLNMVGCQMTALNLDLSRLVTQLSVFSA